ncbi:hypothetical protein ACFW93_20090 [Streptomyces canus]
MHRQERQLTAAGIADRSASMAGSAPDRPNSTAGPATPREVGSGA